MFKLLLHIMKFATLSATVVVYLSLNGFFSNAVKKQIIEEVNICKRNDPQMQKCHCENFNRLIPVIKNGVPEMNIIPIDPVQVESIRMELPKTQTTQFRAELNNLSMHGLSLGRAAQCNAYMTENGIQLAFELVFPKIALQSEYNITGKFSLLAVHGHGNFRGNLTGIDVKTVWNSTRLVKHGKEYLKFTAEIMDIKIEKIQVHFSNIFGNVSDITDSINEVINANVDVLYDEIKPVILQTIRKLSLKIVNDFHATFSLDVLYPIN